MAAEGDFRGGVVVVTAIARDRKLVLVLRPVGSRLAIDSQSGQLAVREWHDGT